MRDTKRINTICQLLERAWHNFPDQRLGQFLLNNVFGSFGRDSHIYMKEDDEIIAILKIFVDKFEEFKKLPEDEKVKKIREFLSETPKEKKFYLKRKVCCVCLHDLSDHIDEVKGYRCHSLGTDGFQCECFLRKDRYDSIEGFQLDKRISQMIEELDLNNPS